MTSIPAAAQGALARAERQEPDATPAPGRDLARGALLLAGLAAIVAIRALAIQSGAGDPIADGLLFGAALLGLAALDRGTGFVRRRTAQGLARSIVIGTVGGVALGALALAGRALAGAPTLPPVFRADLFPVWAVATIVVASGEEAILRGRLLDRLMGPLGLAGAILLTSLAFALMHVPFYGWRVVPLDFGVGLFLAGLRIAARGIAAPAIAHAIADLATWWL